MRRASLLLVLFLYLCSACATSDFSAAPVVENRDATLEALAIDELVRCAESGEEIAVLELARRYADGNGTQQDALVALELYKVIAESASDKAVVAQTRIGRLYMEGVSPIKQDFVEAYIWFDRVITDRGRDVVVDKERVLRLHNFSRLNMTDAERIELIKRLESSAY